MTDEHLYQQRLSGHEREWESRCAGCGACCGAFEDPCEHLRMGPDKRYICAIYADRFGMRKTLSGQVFRCVPIREKLGYSWPGDERCGYKNPLS